MKNFIHRENAIDKTQINQKLNYKFTNECYITLQTLREGEISA